MPAARQRLRPLNLQVCSPVEVDGLAGLGQRCAGTEGGGSGAIGSQAAEAGSLACSWGCWRTRGWVETITIEEEHTGALTAFLLPFLFLPPRPQGGGTLVPGGEVCTPGGWRPGRRAKVGAAAVVADATGPSPALPCCLLLLPAPPPLHPLHPPHPPGPWQPRLGELPAAPGPLSLCLGPPDAPGPAQQATRGRRRLRGLSVMEKLEKSRPSVTATTVTTITITTTITGRRPSHHPASSPISSPRAPPTLSDHFLCIG